MVNWKYWILRGLLDIWTFLSSLYFWMILSLENVFLLAYFRKRNLHTFFRTIFCTFTLGNLFRIFSVRFIRLKYEKQMTCNPCERFNADFGKWKDLVQLRLIHSIFRQELIVYKPLIFAANSDTVIVTEKILLIEVLVRSLTLLKLLIFFHYPLFISK